MKLGRRRRLKRRCRLRPTPRRTAPANDKSVDRSLPPHLPREPHVHRPETTPAHHDAQGQPCGCGECGGRLREIGRDVSEQLEYVPGRFKVVRHVRPKLACVRCQRVFQAAAPSRPIARGLPGPALLAHVMVSKYCDHQPLYRQSGMYARDGVELDRSTMAGWVAKGDALIDPLVAAIRRYAMACDKIHGDDTPVKVLAPGTGKTRTARLWVYVRDDRPAGDSSPRAAWFAYSPDRGGEHPQEHLRGFRGALCPRGRGFRSRRRRDMLARGGVVLSTSEGTRMTTEELEYLNLANKIRSDRLVRVERQGDVLEGVGFESDPALEHFEFRTKVRATVRNSGGVQLETREGPK